MNALPLSRRRAMLLAASGLVGTGLAPRLASARGSATPKRGGTLNVVMSLTPTSLLTLATTAGSDDSISAKMTEGMSPDGINANWADIWLDA